MKIRPLKKKETKNINKKNLGFLEVPYIHTKLRRFVLWGFFLHFGASKTSKLP